MRGKKEGRREERKEVKSRSELSIQIQEVAPISNMRHGGAR